METEQIGTYVMVGLTIGLLVFIWKQRQRNITSNQEKPAIAGQDEIGGAAINPEQFDEPDDDALDEMHDLLETITHWAAELQSMSPDKLNTLMKLGAGVSKIIDIKDKLLSKG